MRKHSAHGESPTCHPLSRCCVETDGPPRAVDAARYACNPNYLQIGARKMQESGVVLWPEPRPVFHLVAVRVACEADVARCDLPFHGERSAVS